MFWTALKREFRLKNLYYNYPNERVFYCCHWRFSHLLYVAIRLVLALYTIFGFCHQVYDYIEKTSSNDSDNHNNETHGDRKNFDEYQLLVVYMTVWSYMVLVVHFTLQALLSIIFYRRAAAFLRQLLEKDGQVKHTAVTVFPAKSPHEQHQNVGLDTKAASVVIRPSKERGLSNPGYEAEVDEIEVPSQTQATANGKNHDAPSNGTSASYPGSSLVAQTSQDQNTRTTVSSDPDTPPLYGSFSRFQEEGFEAVKTPWYFKLSWILSDISSTVAPIVTIVFFVALYPTMDIGKEGKLDLVNANVHLLNTVLTLVDFAVSARPVRILHVWTTAVYGTVYIFFTICYWAADHENNIVYSVLDWNSPGSAMLFVLGLFFVALPVITLMFFGLHHLKLYVHKRLYGCTFDRSLE